MVKQKRKPQKSQTPPEPEETVNAPGKGKEGIPLFWQREIADLKDLLLCALVIPITWMLYLGWSPRLSLMGHDGIAQIWPFLSVLVEQGGDWHQAVYRTQVLGGTKIHDVFGSLPVFRLLSGLGVSTLNCMNLGVLFIQFCFAFAGIKAVTSFAPRDKIPWPLDITVKTALVWLLAFSPLLAWRLGMGHLNLVLGLLVVLTVFSLSLWYCQGAVSITFAAVALWALVNSIPSFGQQIIVYAAVFGLPLIAAVFIPDRKTGFKGPAASRLWVAPGLGAGFFVIGLCLTMPMFAGMISNATGDDATRALNKASVIYSYTVATARDWLGSVFWHELIDPKRAQNFLHETNYPWGPLLLTVLLFIRRKSWWIVGGLVLGTLLSVGFASKVPPFSELLPAWVPLLKSFRVPARAIIPVQAVWLLLSLGLIWQLSGRSGWEKAGVEKRHLAILAALPVAAGLFYYFPPLLREILAWCLTGLLVFRPATGRTFRPLVFVALIFILAALNLQAFRDRIPEFVDLPKVSDLYQKLGRMVIQHQPEMDFPLNRVSIQVPGVQANAGITTGLATAGGYGFPPRRFSQMYQVLDTGSYNPLWMAFDVRPGMPAFPALQQLYNIRGQVRISETGGFLLDTFPGTPGPYWVSRQLLFADDFTGVAEEFSELLSQGNWSETQLLNRSDPKTGFHRGGEYESCREVVLGQAGNIVKGQSYWVPVSGAARDCPVTLSQNYVSNIRVTARVEGKEKTVTAYPAYGSLTAFILPKGATRFTVDAAPYLPAWAKGMFYLGILLCAGLAVFLLKWQTAPQLPDTFNMIDPAD